MVNDVLEGLTVLEITGGVAGAYCSRLLRAHGAKVIKVEPPGGDESRSLLPRSTENGESGLFAWLNAGKDSICLALPDKEDALLELARHADICLFDDSLPDQIDLPDHLITCDISWFGRRGPYAAWHGSEGVIAALSGLAFGIGEKDGPPVLPSGYEPSILAGVTASIAILATLIARLESNHRHHIELSIQDAFQVLTEVGIISPSYGLPVRRTRMGVNRFPPTFPMGIYPCAEGWVGITALTPSQWRALCDLLEEPGLAEETRYLNTGTRLREADRIEAAFRPKLLKWSARELVEQGQAMRIPLALVPTPKELLALPEFTERNAVSTVETPSGQPFLAPDIPFRLTATPGDGSGRAPAPDEYRQEDDRVREASSPGNRGLPLEGVRIIDLTMGWSGPLATRYFADLGADVIKVEACQYPDWWRGWEASKEWLETKQYEKMPSFNCMNRNKRGITLDLTTEAGSGLLKQLVRHADALIENNTATVLPKLGLSREELSKCNPQLVMMSMPAYGMGSKWSHFRAYGSTVEQASGLPHLNGQESWPPTHQHVALGDAVAGLNAAVGLLLAVYHKRRTGHGQFVDFSQVESLLALGAHGIIEQSLNDRPWPRCGSRHPDHAPHGVYPCSGEDQWIAITVLSDNQWRPLATILDLDAQWSTEQRLASQDLIDERISQWTSVHLPSDAMNSLQDAGVPAGIVYATPDIPDDPHIQSVGTYEWAAGVHRESVLYPRAAFFLNGRRPGLASPAPKLGEHNNAVFSQLLGLGREEIAELQANHVIGDSPILKTGQ